VPAPECRRSLPARTDNPHARRGTSCNLGLR
jgi:hypothetical protein